MKKNLLITGGAGYIGGRLLEHFSGWNVRIADRAQVLQDLPVPDGAQKAPVELEDDNSLRNACEGMDAVIHLAALNEIDSARDPAAAFRITTLGTLNLLKAAAEKKVKRFVYFSTAHVYGAPLRGRIDENTLPRPVHPYSTTHKAAEDLVNEYHDRKMIEGIVIRLSNSFGYPHYKNVNRWTLVVNDLCRQTVTGKKLVLKSSGIQKRDFITLTDVCRGVEHLLGLETDFGNRNVFNLGGKNAVSVYDIARMVAAAAKKTLGYEPPVERPEAGPDEKADSLDYRIDRIMKTGFRLKANVTEEIELTLARCRDWFGGENAR